MATSITLQYVRSTPQYHRYEAKVKGRVWFINIPKRGMRKPVAEFKTWVGFVPNYQFAEETY